MSRRSILRMSVARASSEIDDMFHNSPLPTKAESEKAFLLGFVASLGNVKAFILSICGAVVFTIMLVSANTMAMSVRNRTREVAVLKTLGFTRQRVLSIFVSESVALALAGGALGILAAIPLTRLLTHRFLGLGIPSMDVNKTTAALALLVSLILGRGERLLAGIQGFANQHCRGAAAHRLIAAIAAEPRRYHAKQD